MASMLKFPTDPKKIRARIRDYQRKLQREKEEHGAYQDGAGKRFFLGPLHMLAGDLDGALESFRWFEKEFGHDDDGEAEQCLCWALALYRSGDLTAAKRKVRQTMLMNVHILPRLLGRKIVPTKPTTKDDCDLDLMYLGFIPEEFFALWTEAEKRWAAELYESREFRAARIAGRVPD